MMDLKTPALQLVYVGFDILLGGDLHQSNIECTEWMHQKSAKAKFIIVCMACLHFCEVRAEMMDN